MATPTDRSGLPTAILALVAALLASPVFAEPPLPATIAPLAGRSLLLDAATAGERLIAVGERGHILVSDDGGENWRQVVAPTRATLTAVYFADPRNGWAVGHDATILHTRDGGAHWRLQHREPEPGQVLLDVWFRDPTTGYAVGAYGLLLATSDGGETWTPRSVDADSDSHLNAIAADSRGILYLAGERGALYRSEDGRQWTRLESPYEGSFFGLAVTGADTLLVFGLRGHAYRSGDRGASWQAIDTGTTASLMGGGILNDGAAAIAGLSGAILLSHDDGRTFDHRTLSDRSALATARAAPSNGLLLFGENGITHYSPEPVAGTSRHEP